jgi:hypothetical protein
MSQEEFIFDCKERKEEKDSIFMHMFCGSLAGVIKQMVGLPIENIKVHH